MCVRRSPAEIQTQTHWNLIGRSMTAPPLVSSPSNIIPPLRLICVESEILEVWGQGGARSDSKIVLWYVVPSLRFSFLSLFFLSLFLTFFFFFWRGGGLPRRGVTVDIIIPSVSQYTTVVLQAYKL